MAKKWKILIAVAVVAVVVTGIAVPIALYGDGLEEIVAGNKIYTFAQVKEAQQKAFDELAAEKLKHEETIATYNRLLDEKEAFWQDKYNNMVAEKDAEIARLRGLLEEARGYANTLENYMLTYFNLSYDSVDSAEMNGLMLEVFRNMEAQTVSDLEDYEAELAKLPADIQSELDSLESKVNELNIIQNYLNNQDPNMLTHILLQDVLENNLYIKEQYYQWQYEGNSYHYYFYVYFRNPETGDDYPVALINYKSSDSLYIPGYYVGVDYYEAGRALYHYDENGASIYYQFGAREFAEYLYNLGFYDFTYKGHTLPPPETVPSARWSHIVFFLVEMLSAQNAMVINKHFDEWTEPHGYFFDYSHFVSEGNAYKADITAKNARIAVLNKEIIDLHYMLYGLDGVDDGAIYNKGYYTSLKTQTEGSLKAIREKIQQLEEVLDI